jgi:3-dehydroquinate dehydratase type I
LEINVQVLTEEILHSSEFNKAIKALPQFTIATHNLEAKGDNTSFGKKLPKLSAALGVCFDYLNLEFTVDFADNLDRLKSYLNDNNLEFDHKKQLIIEYVDLQKTPEFTQACLIMETILRYQPFAVKFFSMANQESDLELAQKLLKIYANQTNLIAILMGDIGIPSRINCLKQGGWASYVHLGDQGKACPGQLYWRDFLDRVKASD